jgi:hypothetical protein
MKGLTVLATLELAEKRDQGVQRFMLVEQGKLLHWLPDPDDAELLVPADRSHPWIPDEEVLEHTDWEVGDYDSYARWDDRFDDISSRHIRKTKNETYTSWLGIHSQQVRYHYSELLSTKTLDQVKKWAKRVKASEMLLEKECPGFRANILGEIKRTKGANDHLRKVIARSSGIPVYVVKEKGETQKKETISVL